MSDDIKESPKTKMIIELFNSKENIIKKDILFFKEEILKEINQFEKVILNKNKEINKNIEGKYLLIDSSINDLTNKFKEIAKLSEINTYLKEQINNWSLFKREISDISTSNTIKINFMEKDINDNIFRINKILNNSVIYPRIIGNSAKFKTFHEYIDYNLEQLSTTDNFRNKIELDLNSFKTKIDKIIQTLKLKIETSIIASHQLVQKGLKENENIIK